MTIEISKNILLKGRIVVPWSKYLLAEKCSEDLAKKGGTAGLSLPLLLLSCGLITQQDSTDSSFSPIFGSFYSNAPQRSHIAVRIRSKSSSALHKRFEVTLTDAADSPVFSPPHHFPRVLGPLRNISDL